jgi:beta-glucosidase-like glycosyl hydrolase
VLQKELGFQGLIFTDALNMKAGKFSTLGRSIYAFLRGTMFYYFRKMPLALDAFRKAYQDSLFTDSRLASSVKKILKFKYRAGLNSVSQLIL